MVIDVISYNGEKELFEIRYNILKDYVDQFIIVEAPHTFSGLEKPLYFKEILDKYDKVKYHVIDENYTPEEIKQAYESPNTVGPDHWKNEFLQKESIHKALTHLDDEDIVYISDCDEIWNPNHPKPDWTEIYKLKQIVYCYHLNNRSNEPWAGTFVGKYKNLKGKCLNHLRANASLWLNRPDSWRVCLENGGWHFTSMGGLDMFRRKLMSSYTEEDYFNYATQAKLEENYKNNKDWMEGWQRPFVFTLDESDWPTYLKDNREKYVSMLRNN